MMFIYKFIKSFDKKILTKFVEWKKIAEKTIDTEIFGDLYSKYEKSNWW